MRAETTNRTRPCGGVVAVGLAAVLAGCGARGHGVDVRDGARAVGACRMAWTSAWTSGWTAGWTAADGLAVVEARCQFPALTRAGHRAGAARLADLARPGYAGGAIGDGELRATAEYRSFMDPRNVWQWGERVTDAEALAACRLMMADMGAGRMVDWHAEARGYLSLVRGARSAPDPTPGATRGGGSGPGRGGGAAGPGVRQPDGLDRRPPRVPVRAELDRWWEVLDGVRWDYGDRELADRLGEVLALAEVEAGALAVVFAGAAAVVVTVEIGGEAVTYELTLAAAGMGSAALDRELASRLGQPLLDDFAHQLHDIEALSSEAGEAMRAQGGPSTATAWRLSPDQRLVYRELIHRPVAALGQAELEHIQWLREAGGIADVFETGTAAHKAAAWARYRARGGAWSFERWSPGYDRNIRRPGEAHAVADAHWRELGWGQREVRVEANKVTGEWRVHDIADEEGTRAVEVKSGYVVYDADVARQARLDGMLVRRRWTITWHVNGRCSEPVRVALRNAGITLVETHPDMPVKEVRQLWRKNR